MATKTVTIMKDAYDLLKAHKKKNESFSQMIRRHFQEDNLMQFAGILSEKEGEEIKELVNDQRKKSHKRLMNDLRRF